MMLGLIGFVAYDTVLGFVYLNSLANGSSEQLDLKLCVKSWDYHEFNPTDDIHNHLVRFIVEPIGLADRHRFQIACNVTIGNDVSVIDTRQINRNSTATGYQYYMYVTLSEVNTPFE